MTTAQTILLSVLALVMIICYFGAAYSEKDTRRVFFIVIWGFASGFLFIIAIVTSLEMNRLKKLNGKYPEYERIENVYKLKQ